MCIGRNKKIETVFYNGAVMKNSKEDKIIGFIFDNQLKSKCRVGNICKKSVIEYFCTIASIILPK